MNILLGVTGSVAATLTPRIVQALSYTGTVEVVTSRAALAFFDPKDVDARVWTDEDERTEARYTTHQSILHIDLRRRADAYLIAPCTAETLAKLAGGRADNLLTTVARAWDLAKPLILAPAMNTLMWEHPATSEHLTTLRRWYGEQFVLVPPVAKRLACGDEGVGALARIDTILHAVQEGVRHAASNVHR